LALKLNMRGENVNEREPKLPPLVSAVEGLPGDSSGPGYRHSAALARSQRKLLGWRSRILGFAEAIAAEQEDLGVLDEAVGDRRGDGCIEEYVAPVGERGVGGYDCRTLLAVAGGNDLIEEIRRRLVEGQIAKLVAKCSAEHFVTWTKPLRGIWVARPSNHSQ
jgi:hypothetical protein